MATAGVEEGGEVVVVVGLVVGDVVPGAVVDGQLVDDVGSLVEVDDVELDGDGTVDVVVVVAAGPSSPRPASTTTAATSASTAIDAMRANRLCALTS